MPSKSKASEEQQLREEAMAEWLARGLPVDDFSMEKMLELWDEEDGDDEEDAQEALEDKQELMQGFQLLAPIIEQAKDVAAQIRETVKQEAKSAIATAWKYAELPPLRRRRLLREHVADVRTMDAEAHKYSRIKQRVLDEFEAAKQTDAGIQFGLKKRNQRRAPLLHRTREMREEAEQEKHARVLKESRQKRQARLDKEALEKREREEESEHKRENELIERRQKNQRYWQKHLEEARAFSAKQTREQDRKEAFDAAVSEIKAEIHAVDGEEVADAELDMDRNETQSGLGVFGRALEAGEWHSEVDGGHQVGMDEHTIGLFSARGFAVEHERKRVYLMEAQSKVAMLEEKLEQAQLARDNLLHERRTLIERKNQHIQEIQVIASEYNELNAVLAGPPRRDPKDKEKLQFHTLVTKRAQHLEHIKSLDARQRNIDKKMDIIARSEATFEPLLAEAKRYEAALEQELADITKDRHDLPIVVGTSIFQAPSLGDGQKPAETPDAAFVTEKYQDPTLLLNQVAMESKLHILKTAAAPVDEHYKKSRNAMLECWKTGELKNQAEQDLEASQTRLASIRDRILEHQAASRRSDLMLAIQRFHKGPHKLRQCIFPIKGQFEWWPYCNASKSFCVEWDDQQNGICRQHDELSAKFTGSIRFPKRSRYYVRFGVLVSALVTPSSKEDEDTKRPSVDAWQLFIGADFDALQLNEFRDPAGSTMQCGEFEFEFSGPRLCFSFEFRRLRDGESIRAIKTGRGCSHVLMGAGSFEERLEDFREEEKLEHLIQRENHFVSELVKTLRLQSEHSSSQRCAELLQELIVAEKSRETTWDSKMFHGHAQRFQREHYIQMLRAEIKKEISKQIDEEIVQRKAGPRLVHSTSTLDTGLSPIQSSSVVRQLDATDASRVQFQERKAELLRPHIANVKSSLGFYCSFKSHVEAVAKQPHQCQHSEMDSHVSYGQSAMVVGIRYEWRSGRAKVHALQKLARIVTSNAGERTTRTQWSALDDANAIYLGSQCAKALQERRKSEAQAREILTRNLQKIEQVHQETEKTRQESEAILAREAMEDEIRKRQKDRELQRRELLFYADGMRQATYNESVSAQIDFQVQRQVASFAEKRTESEEHAATEKDEVVRSVKENFARSFMAGRLQLVKKTWQRREKRIDDRHQRERNEREFRIRQEQQLINDIHLSNQQELSMLKEAQEEHKKDQLKIANFTLAVQGGFECEHRSLKAWGSKYASGQRCKACGKEMAASYDDPLHGRGADPTLDEDVRLHRAQTTSGVSLRFRDSKYLQAIESERIRLEKEARLIEESEVMLYNRVAPKEIDALDFRHGLNRKAVLDGAKSDDPLYQRLDQDVHRAAFQEEVLFHARLRNFHFRIRQINEQHSHYTVLLSVQIDFLDRARLDSSAINDKLPLVERDYERTITLLEEDAAALSAFESAKAEVSAAMREREAAHHAIEGVEQEAEFAEFHAPSLVKSSDEMAAVCARFSSEREESNRQLASTTDQFERILADREKAAQTLRRLKYRTPKTFVRTRFGVATVRFYREEDECLVVDLLSWEAVVYIPVGEIIALEDELCEEERAMMMLEDAQARHFYQYERKLEERELSHMEVEDRNVRFITAWRIKKESDEDRMKRAICRMELGAQLIYELDEKPGRLEMARREANKLLISGRVAFGNRKRRKPGRMDLLRAARACEKRLAMAAVEEKLLRTNLELQTQSQSERDSMYAQELSSELLLDFTKEIMAETSEEVMTQERYKACELERALNRKPAIAEWGHESTKHETTPTTLFPGHIAVGLNRLWVARRKKWSLQFATWKTEMNKLHVLRQELARRAELRRIAEEERLLRERHQREMLVEERLCRKFYLEEMVQCMQERKAIASAEADMRDYLRKLELEAMKTKYAKMVEDRYTVNDKAARRLEIKLGKNEQHRLHREWTQIKVEDAMALQIRETELAQAQAEALERQFDKYLVAQAMNGRISAELEASRIKERLMEVQRIAEEERSAFLAKLEQERMMATVETLYVAAAAELKWMDAMERTAYWRRRAEAATANLNFLEPKLEEIMAERAHVVADAIAKHQYADKCKARVVAAEATLINAVQKSHVCEQQFKKIHRENAIMDSSVLHDRVQLFNTIYLRDQLHARYFALLVDRIVRQAIVEASEREVTRLEQKLRQLSSERAFKAKEVGVLQRKRRRENHMRMRRAELGKLMFGMARCRVLKERFQQWVELWSRRTVVRASFEFKHNLLLQERRLVKAAADTTAQIQPSLRVKQSPNRSTMKSGSVTKLSVLHDHQKRRVECRLCRIKYSEDQNNRFACAYHPGMYEFACVRTCSTRRDVSGNEGASSSPSAKASVSPACMMHRAKRWLCCDETDEGRYGSTGCQRRFHLPVRDEPAMAELVAAKSNHEQALIDQVNQQLLELRERDVVGKIRRVTKTVVSKMEQELADKRAVAAKYHTLDRRR